MGLGKVYLVGAGPGDRGLITVKAFKYLEKADVVVYDRLVNVDLLDYAREDAEIIYVGKESSFHLVPQDRINEIILEKAKLGKTVVRLKGGDPYVFGRGGEEGESLYDNGIEFEVVPGITSAIGGLCYAGIPITHRDMASSFHVITGHQKNDINLDMDWSVVGKDNGTLVFLMSIENIREVVNGLVSNGKDEDTPIAFISWASTYRQKKIVSTLKNAISIVENKEIQSPALFVVGNVVTLSDKLDFFARKPLYKKTVIITRNKEQNSIFRDKLEELGAKVIEVSTIKIKTIYENSNKLIDAIKNKTMKAIAFTSSNAVKSFFEILKNNRIDTRILSDYDIFSIGSHTSYELEKHGIYNYIESMDYTGAGLADTINKYYISMNHKENKNNKYAKKNIELIYPCSKIATNNFVHKLSKEIKVNRVEVYENQMDTGYRERLISSLEEEKCPYIAFSSSSAVNNIMNLIGMENKKLLEKAKIISIGRVTTKTIEKYNLKVFKEADKPSIDYMIEAMKI